MDERGLRSGHLVALAGAVAAVGSLWAHWYQLTFTDALRAAINGQANALLSPALAQYAHVAVSSLPPSVQATAWQAFHQTDIAVAVLSGLVLLVVLAAAGSLGPGITVDLSVAGSVCAALGAACAAIIANRVLHPPGGSSAVTVVWGAWVGLGGGVAMMLGGLWAATGRSASTAASTIDPWAEPKVPATASALAEPSASVAPPGP